MEYIEQVFFSTEMNSYKGNVHMHTTNSDGYYEPARAVEIYKERGYDFVALSDHRKYVKTDEYNSEDFVVLNAFEMTSECKETGKLFHIHGFVDEDLEVTNHSFEHLQRMPEPKYESLATTQKIIDSMKAGGMSIMMNHPAWSHNSLEEILTLHNYYAIEIYNHKAEIRNGTGSSVGHWDYLLNKGRRVVGIASDDSHDNSNEAVNGQYFGGWIVVNGDRLATQPIIEAIKEGRFYSSTGPKIEKIQIVNDTIEIECSKVKKIKFLTGCLRRDRCIMKSDLGDVESGHYKIKGNEKYVRIECIDERGLTAWSNPIYIDDIRKEKVFI